MWVAKFRLQNVTLGNSSKMGNLISLQKHLSNIQISSAQIDLFDLWSQKAPLPEYDVCGLCSCLWLGGHPRNQPPGKPDGGEKVEIWRSPSQSENKPSLPHTRFLDQSVSGTALLPSLIKASRHQGIDHVIVVLDVVSGKPRHTSVAEN